MWKRLSRWAAVLAIFVGIGVVSSKYVARRILAAKTVHNAAGTVVGKEYVRFDEGMAFYTNDDGAQIPLRPGEQQWRIYYRIDRLPEGEGSKNGWLLQAEQKRVANGRPRVWILTDKDCYDRTPVGGNVTVSYRAASRDLVEVVGVDFPACQR